MGLRQDVKQGKLSPTDAFKWLYARDDSPSPKIVLWLLRRGGDLSQVWGRD